MTRKTTTIRGNVTTRLANLGIFNDIVQGSSTIDTITNSTNVFPACTVALPDGNYDDSPLDGVGDILSTLELGIYYKKSLGAQVLETELDVLGESVENDFESGDKTFSNSIISIVPDSFNYVIDTGSGIGVLNLTYNIKFKR